MGIAPHEVSQQIRDHAAHWEALKKTKAALHGEDMDALKVMGHDELAELAWKLFNCIEAAEPYAYLMSSLEGHLEGPGSHQEGWVIAQADGGDNQGGFNKWSKASGGYAEESGPYGDWLLFENWKAARLALAHKPDDVRANFKIYPVVVTAGNEPRITCPPEELK